jgi:signal recognition particle subunit SRP54
VLGEQLKMPVFAQESARPPQIAKSAIAHAEKSGNDVVLLDTAGRLHIDDEMMRELEQVKAAVQPIETLLIVDAMTGQDAVNFALEFHQRLAVTGYIMTKLDGDARGGGALSIRGVTGVPIKFIGVGEKLDALDTFHPERMASRILGMGDVLSLIEKAEQALDHEKAQELERRLRQDKFDLNDFLDQLQQMKNLGPLDQILGMIPGMNKLKGAAEVDEKQLKYHEAIVQSMTKAERSDPGILNGSRKRRIAHGSGRSVQEINEFLKQFEMMRQMIRQMTGMSGGGFRKKRRLRMPFG